ncbi:MAG: hypothetical protein KDB07_00285, partial [Planctomycetes bacterium]|nr:hypothetical protein [Planctomycetota bacterium]
MGGNDAQADGSKGGPWEKLAEAVDQYHHAQKKEAAGQLGENDRSPSDLLPAVDTAYWRLMTEKVSELVPEKMSDNLVFDEQLTYALNYGVIKGHKAFKWVVDKVQGFVFGEKQPKLGDHPVVFVTQALNQSYRDILRVDVIHKLNEEMQRIQDAIDEAPNERADAIKRRNDLITAGINDPSDADKLRSHFKQVDDELENMKMLEKKQRQGGFSGKEERDRFISLKQ